MLPNHAAAPTPLDEKKDDNQLALELESLAIRHSETPEGKAHFKALMTLLKSQKKANQLTSKLKLAKIFLIMEDLSCVFQVKRDFEKGKELLLELKDTELNNEGEISHLLACANEEKIIEIEDNNQKKKFQKEIKILQKEIYQYHKEAVHKENLEAVFEDIIDNFTKDPQTYYEKAVFLARDKNYHKAELFLFLLKNKVNYICEGFDTIDGIFEHLITASDAGNLAAKILLCHYYLMGCISPLGEKSHQEKLDYAVSQIDTLIHEILASHKYFEYPSLTLMQKHAIHITNLANTTLVAKQVFFAFDAEAITVHSAEVTTMTKVITEALTSPKFSELLPVFSPVFSVSDIYPESEAAQTNEKPVKLITDSEPKVKKPKKKKNKKKAKSVPTHTNKNIDYKAINNPLDTVLEDEPEAKNSDDEEVDASNENVSNHIEKSAEVLFGDNSVEVNSSELLIAVVNHEENILNNVVSTEILVADNLVEQDVFEPQIAVVNQEENNLDNVVSPTEILAADNLVEQDASELQIAVVNHEENILNNVVSPTEILVADSLVAQDASELQIAVVNPEENVLTTTSDEKENSIIETVTFENTKEEEPSINQVSLPITAENLTKLLNTEVKLPFDSITNRFNLSINPSKKLTTLRSHSAGSPAGLSTPISVGTPLSIGALSSIRSTSDSTSDSDLSDTDLDCGKLIEVMTNISESIRNSELQHVENTKVLETSDEGKKALEEIFGEKFLQGKAKKTLEDISKLTEQYQIFKTAFPFIDITHRKNNHYNWLQANFRSTDLLFKQGKMPSPATVYAYIISTVATSDLLFDDEQGKSSDKLTTFIKSMKLPASIESELSANDFFIMKTYVNSRSFFDKNRRPQLNNSGTGSPNSGSESPNKVAKRSYAYQDTSSEMKYFPSGRVSDNRASANKAPLHPPIARKSQPNSNKAPTLFNSQNKPQRTYSNRVQQIINTSTAENFYQANHAPQNNAVTSYPVYGNASSVNMSQNNFANHYPAQVNASYANMPQNISVNNYPAQVNACYANMPQNISVNHYPTQVNASYANMPQNISGNNYPAQVNASYSNMPQNISGNNYPAQVNACYANMPQNISVNHYPAQVNASYANMPQTISGNNYPTQGYAPYTQATQPHYVANPPPALNVDDPSQFLLMGAQDFTIQCQNKLILEQEQQIRNLSLIASQKQHLVAQRLQLEQLNALNQFQNKVLQTPLQMSNSTNPHTLFTHTKSNVVIEDITPNVDTAKNDNGKR